MGTTTSGGAGHDATSERLAAQRTTRTFVKTLVWKNWLLKKRHPVALALEVLLPAIFIVLVGLMRNAVKDSSIPAGWSDDRENYNLFDPNGGMVGTISTTTPRFYTHETTMTGLLLSLGALAYWDVYNMGELPTDNLAACRKGLTTYGAVAANVSSPHRIPEACGDKISPYKIAIAPDNVFTREYFMQTMDAWYPRIKLGKDSNASEIPSLRENIVFYASTDDLESYVSSGEYGSDPDHPRIYGAIVFDQFPSDSEVGKFSSLEYTIRMNSTKEPTEDIGLIPRTSGSPPELSPFQRELKTDYYSHYAVSGFMTLQTLVTRFVTCMPVWDSAKKSTSGKCQRELSTAKSSDDLDARLLSVYDDDAQLKIAKYALTVDSSANFSSLVEDAPEEAKEALLKPLRQAPQSYLGAAVAPFPIEAYAQSPFYSSIKSVFPIIFILAYLYCLSRILVAFIHEKESRQRELMRILGVSEGAIITSWYITYGLILLVSTIIQVAAGLVGLFANSSLIVMFLFFYLFGLSTLAFGFCISAIFSKARVGSLVGLITFFIMYFVSSSFSVQTPESSKALGCLFPPVALSLGVQSVADLESTGQGATFANIGTASENFRLSSAFVVLIVDVVLYTVVGIYFEKVIPKEWGTTQKWYFPVSPSYWRDRRAVGRLDSLSPHCDPAADDLIIDVNPSVEPVNAELREQERDGQVLSVQRLRKEFAVPGGTKVAVKGLNLVMYKDHITCLLGHNGAGKTTLISMLTGMIAPSSGTATFQGMSFTEDMDDIRQSLGICFQQDVLYADLSVEEHLFFYGRIKGYAEGELTEVVNRQIEEVGLTEKRLAKSSDLSGGMKRKLSVAISLLGDSSLVFLDEPTSGMDPYSRRSTWEILLNNRNGRVMVLTTHFMDEADILGDRIAIMAEGELRCCGSSLFLKNRYGAGYNLTLVKDDKNCNDSEVISFVNSFVPDTQVLSNVGSEIAFQLSLDASHIFARMFSELDNRLSTLGLLSYGVSVTTLEEVFIKVAEAGDDDQQHTLNKLARLDTTSPMLEDVNSIVQTELRVSRESLFMTHLSALLLKRFRIAKRDRKMVVFSMILPILLITSGLVLLKAGNRLANDPKITLLADAYEAEDQSPTPYFCQADGDKWCSAAMSPAVFTGAKPEQLSNAVIQKYNSSTPTVFDVVYDHPSINQTDATGYGLRLGEELYSRGYGKNGREITASQYGSYLMYGDSGMRVLSYNIFVNTTSTHGAAIFKALMDQAIYRFFAGNASGDVPNVELKVNSHPLPLSASSKAFIASITAFAACMIIAIAFSFYPASIAVFLVKEKQPEHNSKHQQLVSGVSLTAFWLANYVWDMVVYVVPFGAALILIQIFDISALTGNGCASCSSETFPAVVALFLLFGFAVCPFTYCLSYLFKEHASSQTYTIIINFVLGVVLMVASFVMGIVESTVTANDKLIFIWRLSPLFNLGNGLLNLAMNEMSVVMEGEPQKSPFSTDVMGYELLFLAISAVLFGVLAITIDYAMTFPNVRGILGGSDQVTDDQGIEQDIDVIKEAQRIQANPADDVVVLKNLRKTYKGGKVAVRGLSFGLKQGECFGFLGINGAGKTTTMKMLTGDVVPSSGTATLSGFDILTQQIEVRRQIGYCPQDNALFDLLTVREHLELFARIKGISSEDLDEVVADKIQQLNLSAFENKLAGSLSGGNKRKLSVAIAMIGNPKIIFLDEPSTGMDPVSRRFMWDVIAGISTRSKSATIVLTTHSMEECEALCSRVSIMVGGHLRCLGSVQHLKSRFGDGLVFDVKVASPSADEMQEMIERHFSSGQLVVTPMELEEKCAALGDASFAGRIVASHPSGYNLASAMDRDGFVRAEAFCTWFVEETRFEELELCLRRTFGEGNIQVIERQNDFCRFKLCGSSAQVRLSTVFERIERVKAKMHIREYSVSQTTLEQIFNQFASQQAEEQGVARGMMAA